MSQEGPSDEQLMAAYVGGDEGAFRAIFDRHAGPIFRLVRKRLRTDEDARDVVQQTFLQMHRARLDFRHDSRLRPWLYTIAMNLMREHHRRRGRRPQEVSTEHDLAEDPAPGAVDGLERRERDERVREALRRLPDNQREVIELHWLADVPFDEVARIVGASPGAVRVRAHRGYERLRAFLSEEA